MIDFNCGIYTITSPSGKQYIGSAINFARRWREHKSQLRRGVHFCRPLQSAFDKYGESGLVFAKIAFVPREELLLREQEQLDARPRKRLYNVLPQAGSMLGMRHTVAARERMSAARKGIPKSESHRAAIGAAHKGRQFSEEHRAKIGAKTRARPVTDATRAKLSKASKGRVFSEESRKKKAASLFGRKQASNTSGFVGVSPYRGRWMAYVTLCKQRKHIGYFDTPEQAADARLAYLKGLQISTEN